MSLMHFNRQAIHCFTPEETEGQYVTLDMSAVKQACIPDTGMDRSLPDFIVVPGMVQGQ